MSVHVCQRSMFAVSVAHCVCVLAPPLQVSSWERVCDLAEASSQRAVAHTWCWKVVVSNLRLRVYFWKHLGKLFKRSSVCVCVCVAARTCSVHVIYLYWCIILLGHYWDTSVPGHVVLRSAYLKISHFRTQGDLKQNHEILFWKHNVTAFEWYLKMYVA